MDSFHRADWIGVAQALGGALAVVAAFSVSSLQARHSARLRRLDGLERLDGLAKLVELTRTAVESVIDDAEKKSSQNGLKVLSVENTQAAAVVFGALKSVSIEDAPSAASVQALIEAKTALVQAQSFVPDLEVDRAARFYVMHVDPLKQTAESLKSAEDALRLEHRRLAAAI